MTAVDLLDLERERARATAGLAARLVDTTNTIGATVAQTPYTDNTGFVAVHIDGDPPGTNVLLPFTGPWSPYLGERCLVLDSPNSGLMVLGPLGPTPTRTWSPTISGTGWAIGNGTTTGLWERIGNWVLVHGNIVFGSTSTFGAGQLNIGGLPLPVRVANISASIPLYLHSGTVEFPGIWRVNGNGSSSGLAYYTLVFAAPPAPAFWSGVTATAPATWASGNFIDIGPILYPVA